MGRHPSAVVREERDLLVVGGLGEARLGRWHLSDPFVCRDWGNLRWEELCEEGHVGEVLPMVVEWGVGGHSLIHASPQVPGTVGNTGNLCSQKIPGRQVRPRKEYALPKVPGDSVVENPPASGGDLGLIPGL